MIIPTETLFSSSPIFQKIKNIGHYISIKLHRYQYGIVCLSLAIIITGVLYSNIISKSQIKPIPLNSSFEKRGILYDDYFASSLANISEIVPTNETLLVTASSGAIKYFTDYQVKVPWGVDSQESLVKYMSKYNLTYLVVVKIGKRGSSIETLRPLFTAEGFKNLEKDFERIANIKTEHTRIYVYKKLDSF